MTVGHGLRRRLVLAALATVAAAASPAFAEDLQPWQMVRSLQLVQDRIADGDQAALPMQRRLLEMIDARLRLATPAELAEPRNWDAVMIFATDGGNPATVRALMPDLLAAADAAAAKDAPAVAPEEAAKEAEKPSAEGHGEAHAPAAGAAGHEGGKDAEAKHGGETEAKPAEGKTPQAEAKSDAPPPPQGRNLALGLYNFGRDREPDAERALAKVDPLGERPELGAFLALIIGSLKAKNDPAAALKLFDQARLVAPGTLVEEAALRRSVALTVQLGDRPRFLLASGQYVRRFLRSPYASQFADAFVNGVIALQDGLDLDAVSGVTGDMAPEQERVVFLRIARQAAIDNLMKLSAFASAKADAGPEEIAASGDPRTMLYAALSEVTGEKPTDTLARLDTLDPKRLTASDRELLEAVKAVALATVRPPPPLPADASPAAQDDAPALPPDTAAQQPKGMGATLPTPAADGIDAGLAKSRKALAQVDQLLVDAGK